MGGMHASLGRLGTGWRRLANSVLAVGTLVAVFAVVTSTSPVSAQYDEEQGLVTHNLVERRPDGLRDSGRTVSMAVASNGLPVLAYTFSDGLRVAFCADVTCSTAEIQMLDTNIAPVRSRVSLALDSYDHPVVSYDGPDGIVTVARCGDPACGTVTMNPLQAGDRASLAVDSNGLPVVVWVVDQGVLGATLTMARCQDSACTSFTQTDVAPVDGDRRDRPAWKPYLALDAQDLPVISYIASNDGARSARLTFCNDMTCTTATERSFGSARYATMLLDDQDRPVVLTASADASNVSFARCDDALCDSFSQHVVTGDPSGHWHGGEGSMAFDRDGLPAIFFELEDGVGGVVRCADASCEQSTENYAIDVTYGSPPMFVDGANRMVFASQMYRSDDVVVTRCATLMCFDELPIRGTYLIEGSGGRVLDADLNGQVGTSSISRSDDIWELVFDDSDDQVGLRFSIRNVVYGTYLATTSTYPSGVELVADLGPQTLWDFRPWSNGSFVIEGTGGTVLTADGPQGLQVELGSERYIWKLIPTEVSVASPHAGQKVALKSQRTGRWLDADGDGAVNQSVRQRADDVWSVVDAGNGYVYLQNDVTGRYLDADRGSSVVDSSAVPKSDDLWLLTEERNGVFLEHVALGGYLTADGSPDYGISRINYRGPGSVWRLVIVE